MTTIVGLVDGETVYIGGDSAGTSDIDCRVRRNRKVFKKDNMIIGYTGSTQVSQILQFHWQPDRFTDFDDLEHLSFHMLSLRTVLREHGVIFKDPGDIFEGAFLIGFRGKLFTAFHDFSISHYADGYDAIGSGSRYALGSLYSTQHSMMRPEYRVVEALQAASFFHPGSTLPPFQVMELNNGIIKDCSALIPDTEAPQNKTYRE